MGQHKEHERKQGIVLVREWERCLFLECVSEHSAKSLREGKGGVKKKTLRSGHLLKIWVATTPSTRLESLLLLDELVWCLAVLETKPRAYRIGG